MAKKKPSTDPPQNRRKHPRVAVPLLVQVKVDSVARFKEDHAGNISTGGLFLRTDDVRPTGSTIYFQFTVKDGGPLIEGMGRVVHSTPPGGDRPAGMGIEFTSVLEPSASIIRALVEERLKKGEAA